MMIAKCISDGQIIVQQVRRYSRVLVCMYIYVRKNSRLLIVGLKLNCTDDCALFHLLYSYIQWSLSHIL